MQSNKFLIGQKVFDNELGYEVQIRRYGKDQKYQVADKFGNLHWQHEKYLTAISIIKAISTIIGDLIKFFKSKPKDTHDKYL